MIKGRHLFTSESVTEGHPDKVADQISDSILDYVMSQDPMGRVACETLVTTGLALVAGEITTKCVIDYASIVRKTVESIGYTDANFGFDFKTCAVMSSMDTQSPDIAMGVDRYRRDFDAALAGGFQRPASGRGHRTHHQADIAGRVA